MFVWIDKVGWHVTQNIGYTYKIFMLAYLSFRSTISGTFLGGRSIISVISSQIYFTGWQAMPIISILALSTGAILSMQALMQMSLLGGTSYIGNFMVQGLVGEVSPLLTALIVVARSGIAVASELASMKVNKEIDALETMGINPLSYVIFPRIVGGTISVLCLSFYFVVIGILFGAAICFFQKGMPANLYFSSIAHSFQLGDIFAFFIKNFVSGMIIFSVCCHEGLQVEKSPHEIPQVTTKAVVKSTVYILVFNSLMTLYLYLDFLVDFGVL